MLDIELALAISPNSEIYVYEGPNSDQGVLNTYNRIATDNLAKQVSTSWGMGENYSTSQFLQAEQAIFLQMAAHGQTIYAAAGDSGAYDDYPTLTLEVDDPASQPYICGVGGTSLTVNRSTGAYSSEKVWNNGQGNGAGGGGVSIVWPIPSWQSNVSTVHSKTHRNVPDVCLNADPDTGYAIYYDGQWTIYGGTSCAAPLWAAFTALINQQRAANNKSTLGYVNPLLYTLGTGSSYGVDFHDVTTGNNLYYSAGKGYDNASGWGSFNGANLFASLTGSTSSSHEMPPMDMTTTMDMTTMMGSSTPAVLNVSMTQLTHFRRGRVGVYQIAVSNEGDCPTSGTVTVAITLPKGITYKSFNGAGWTFDATALTCSYDGIVEAGASFPPIELTVKVGIKASHSVASTVSVSGGGLSSDVTAKNLSRIR